MKLTSIDLSKTNRFSKLFTDYIDSKAALAPFYDRFPKIDNFKEQIKEKQFSLANRQILCQVLEEQYKDYEKKESLEQNLKSLARENTFTITTGHQLNIFTGPLYFIYKIVTVINSCRQLSKAYPDYNFVPVYWMASEDHDFDEISYFWLNGQKHRWETVQSGAVGRFMTDELSKLCDEIPGMPELFKEAYQNYDSLADAGRCYVNALFGDQGLVVIDADNRQLKSLFTSVIEDDVLNNTSYELVEKATADLQKLGYSTQVNPRKINFFYLSKGFRERIENDNEAFKVLNSDISLSKQEILTSISNTPEKYSPNVILRPLYQEMILPNLAYVGGPSEVAYWFQLKSVFDHYKVTFPILMPRNFVAIINDLVNAKIKKIGFKLDELFRPQYMLEKDIALKTTDKKIELNGQRKQLMALFDGIQRQAEDIDKTLVAHVEAQAAITKSKLDNIEKKFIRAEKRKHSEKIGQLNAVLEVLFPANSLQERRDNFLNFYLEDHEFIDKIVETLDPFDYRFHILLDGK